MKRIILICFVFFCYRSEILAQEISFQYDVAGNQIVRQWICINCPVFPTAILSKQQSPEQITAPEGFIENTSLERKLTAYPNPVTEILNVKWWSDDKTFVNAIEIFSIAGIRVFNQKYPALQTETSISFLNLSPGVYVVRAVYSDGKQEVIKVIKQ